MGPVQASPCEAPVGAARSQILVLMTRGGRSPYWVPIEVCLLTVEGWPADLWLEQADFLACPE